MTGRIVRVGLIGCGEVAQVIHIPTLGFLSAYFRITYLCDVSKQALAHCKTRVFGGTLPRLTTDPTEVCSSPDVDVVFVVNSDEYHADHAILALNNDKHVFVEKPLALNLRDIGRLKEAEAASKGKVMVGYMRRYAAAFVDAIDEIGGLDKILYARVRGKRVAPKVSLSKENRHNRTEQRLRESIRYISTQIYRFRGERFQRQEQQSGRIGGTGSSS